MYPALCNRCCHLCQDIVLRSYSLWSFQVTKKNNFGAPALGTWKYSILAQSYLFSTNIYIGLKNCPLHFHSLIQQIFAGNCHWSSGDHGEQNPHGPCPHSPYILSLHSILPVPCIDSSNIYCTLIMCQKLFSEL